MQRALWPAPQMCPFVPPGRKEDEAARDELEEAVASCATARLLVLVSRSLLRVARARGRLVS